MGRSQETFNKKEKEKKRLQKRREKGEKKEERKQAAATGTKKTFEEMLAYVDEDGNLTDLPPDARTSSTGSGPKVHRDTSENPSSVKTGKVVFFDAAKGYGFVEDSKNGKRVFVHQNSTPVAIKMNDILEFTVVKGAKGLQASSIKKIN